MIYAHEVYHNGIWSGYDDGGGFVVEISAARCEHLYIVSGAARKCEVEHQLRPKMHIMPYVQTRSNLQYILHHSP